YYNPLFYIWLTSVWIPAFEPVVKLLEPHFAGFHPLLSYKPSLNTSNFITKTSNVQVQKMMNQTIRAFEIC
ncbi:MAG TPA: hypothetical protein PL124_11425, partial [Candidatus Cloacimonadota bacterium]|nr:hypothetical protein [Candidatus Cloacimonadota bacterium]